MGYFEICRLGYSQRIIWINKIFLWFYHLAKTRLYGAFWKVLLAIHKLVEKYKRYSAHYTTLVFSNQYTKREDRDIRVNYILISINKILNKLHKY